MVTCKSRKENPQKLTQLSSRSHPRHLLVKRTAQKDSIIDITGDCQVNSNFPYRWSPASLTFNNYCSAKQKSLLGTTSNKNYWGGVNWFAVDQLSPLLLSWFTRQNNYDQHNHRRGQLSKCKGLNALVDFAYVSGRY